MAVYLVSYDLNQPGTDYDSLYEKLKNYSGWWHYLDSTWMIISNDNAKTIRDNIRTTLDDNDSLLVIEVKDNYSGWLSEKAWDWMHNNIN